MVEDAWKYFSMIFIMRTVDLMTNRLKSWRPVAVCLNSIDRTTEFELEQKC